MRLLAIIALATLCCMAQAQPRTGSGSGQRVALVIGNDAYEKVAVLRNARADARAMAASLERAGYRVTLRVDANERAMKEALRTFKAQLAGGGAEAVFFFSGHGVQLGGANYLLPTDIGNDSEEQVKDDAIALQKILDEMQDQKARLSLAIIDACRNNPFTGRGRAIGGRGLTSTAPANGQMVLFSAGSGQLALDRLNERDSNPNGVFTRVFLKEMEKPGVPVHQVLRNVRDEVDLLAKSVGQQQTPAIYDQVVGEYYFRPGTRTSVATAPVTQPQTVDPMQVEMMFWDSIRSSTNVREFEDYKRRYPNGQFAGLADARINALTQTPRTNVAVAPSTSDRIPVSAPAPDPSFPSRPVTLIVPFAAGGPTDTIARNVASAMSARLRHPVIVENAVGAGGITGSDRAAKSTADGHTLLLNNISMAAVPGLYRSLPFNALTDFEYVGEVADIPMTVIARPNLPAKTLPELIAYVRANGSRTTYANAGLGSASHLCGLLFAGAVGTAFTAVPFKGTAPAMTSLIGSEIDFMCDASTITASLVRAGRVSSLGVASAQRIAALPDLPTARELGVSGLDMTIWHGIFAPKGTPQGRLAVLSNALRDSVADATLRTNLGRLGAEPVSAERTTSAALQNRLRTEIARWTPIIRSAGQYAD